MRRSIVVIVVAVLALPFLLGARRRAASPLPSLDMRRSFAITDHVILDGFSFERVMNTLVERSDVPGMTATRLYQQWLDTQNPKPGLVAANAPHCDDFLIDGQPSFNGFPRRCPTPEGALATAKPFASSQFIPLAIMNRFDLTASDGSNCGQYRLIYARRENAFSIPGLIFPDTLHFIFEAVLPNPTPEAGLAGCRPVAQFWADLSQVNSISERRAKLEMFFFSGLPGFAPVVRPEHYSRTSGGGIRSFQWTISAGSRPRFYQFRLETTCADNNCQLVMEPDVLQNMAWGKLFDGRIDTPQSRRFRDHFITQVQTLAIADQNRFFIDIPREFLIAESDPVDSELAFLYGPSFFFGQVATAGIEFNARIEAELKRVGSSLKPFQIVNRAETQNCYGCHIQASGLGLGPPFPAPFPTTLAILQHVNERIQEKGEAGKRYSISPAMRDVFIPHRMEILRKFLTTDTPPVRSNSGAPETIGGGRAVQ